jgi:2-oxoglutarate/2-oxoacid ferredoxin oxidoreductase subunit beta
VLRAAAAHEGAAIVEIYQNCNIFNDGAFDPVKDAATRDEVTIRLEHGQPIRFGPDGGRGVTRGSDGTLAVVDMADLGAGGEAELLVHDAHAEDPSVAFALSRIADPTTLQDTPIGIFRDIARPSYDQLVNTQVDQAVERQGRGDLAQLLAGNDTWTLE